MPYSNDGLFARLLLECFSSFFFPPSGVFLSVQRFEDVNFYSFYIFLLATKRFFFFLFSTSYKPIVKSLFSCNIDWWQAKLNVTAQSFEIMEWVVVQVMKLLANLRDHGVGCGANDKI